MIKNSINTAIVSFWITITSGAYSFLNIGVSGYVSKDTYGFKTSNRSNVGINTSIGFGKHLQLGLSHSVQEDNLEGYELQRVSGTNVTVAFMVKDQRVTHTTSVDLTIIPFVSVISPFVFGGSARKEMKIRRTIVGFREDTATTKPEPLLTYGYGVKIFLNKNFDLKVTRRYTPGIKVTLDGEKKEVVDEMTQVGFVYKL